MPGAPDARITICCRYPFGWNRFSKGLRKGCGSSRIGAMFSRASIIKDSRARNPYKWIKFLESFNAVFFGSSEKFVGNFLVSLALYFSIHTGMTKEVVLSVILVETTPVIPPGIGGIQAPGMATKFGSGYVSKYFVDLWTSPSDRPSPFGTCGQPGQTTSCCPLPAYPLRPLAHRVHKGYNNQIIFDAQKIHQNLPVNLLIFQ